VTVDSNEDRFTEEDVRSICSIGQSKKTSSSYIGEKGIGFKSMFKIASQVHIQSEPFSFFVHERGDNGLGMVTSENRDHEELTGGVRTRITLRLAEPVKFEQRVADFLELPDTLLLFLTRIKTITIDICRPNEPSSKIIWKPTRDSTLMFSNTLYVSPQRQNIGRACSKHTKRLKSIVELPIMD
jgi:hypothetical protein